MRVFAVIAAALLAPMAMAQGLLSNDYALVFEEHADRITSVETDGGEVVDNLELPGPIQLQRLVRDGQATYRSVDASEAGAVGCMMGILMEFHRHAWQCPGQTQPEQRVLLENSLVRIAKFYAENRVPAVDVAVVTNAIADHAARRVRGGACPKLDPGTQFREFFDGMLVPGLETSLDELLATPRLPVVNPCL